MRFYADFLKLFFEVIIAFIAIIILSPILIIVAILIKLDSKGEILFRQNRVGKDEKIFSIFKFRTMRAKRYDEETDKERITRLGRFLRKSSIDELPQLFNIVKGDMSFIGPRPLYAKYLPYYTEREKTRHSVRPGMSGLSEVLGRSYLTWDEQFEYDAQYVEKLSFLLDLEIFLKTIPIVLKANNVIIDGRVDKLDFAKSRESKMKNEN